MKKFTFFLLLLSGSFLAVSGQATYQPDPNGILYVDSASTVNPADYNWIGDNWAKAVRQLSDALHAAATLNAVHPGTVKQIWVAKGTYKPLYSAEDGHHEEDGGRKNAFVLIKDVNILGGFAGTESSPDERDTTKLFTDNRTVLSGNTGQGNNVADNVFHVVVASGGTGNARLSGFVITGGNAGLSTSMTINSHLIDNNRGGGMLSYSSDPVISYCIFLKNNAGYAGGGLYLNDPKYTMKLTNCTFSGNRSNIGAGIYNYSADALPIENCTFSENIAQSRGGGIYNEDSYVHYLYSDFLNNEARDGAAIYNKNSGQLNPSIHCNFLGNTAQKKGGALYDDNSEGFYSNCVFSGNQAGDWGGGVYSNNSFSNFTGCLFSGNKANYGGAFNIDNSSKPSIFNCTIAGNLATDPDGGGGIRIYQSSPVIRNSILWNNSSIINYTGYPPDIKYSLVQFDDIAGTTKHNLSQDPLFINPVSYSEAPTTGGNYQIKNNSPAIDIGMDQLPSNKSLPGIDLAGNARVSGLHADAGAYEVQKSLPDKNGILYVNKSVSGGEGNGSSWANAFKELSDALLAADQLNRAKPGTVKQIWVAKGTYHPLYSAEDGHRTESSLEYTGNFYLSDNAFVLLNKVKIYGGFAGTESSLNQRDMSKLFTDNQTILDGRKKHSATSYNVYDKSYHVIVAAGIKSALLNGFVIKNGNAVGINKGTIKVNGQTIHRNVGAGIDVTNSSMTIERCKFSQNYAVNMGGGLHSFNSSFTIADCGFENNHAVKYGGAISLHNTNTLNCLIKNSSFTNNKATDDNSGGGAIYNHSGASLHITSCSFKDNHTSTLSLTNTSGGALYNYGSSPQISHCSFDSNNSGVGGAIYNYHSSPTIENCSFTENRASFMISGTAVKGGAGGAIYNYGSTAQIINCSFFNNEARKFGGAVSNRSESSSLITGCVLKGNRVIDPVSQTQIEVIEWVPVPIVHHLYEGGDVYNDHSKSNIINCTIIPHDYQTSLPKSSFYSIVNNNTSETKIVNSIIWGNEEFELAPPSGTSTTDNKTEVSYSIIQMPSGSVADGEGNLNKNPQFVDPANGNYQLKESSPAIAAGSSGAIQQYHLPDADMANNPRVVDGKVNMGAFASTFVHPKNLTATYDSRDTVTVRWSTPLNANEAYVSGDNFKLERSTDSTFQQNVKTITSTLAYNPDKKNYTVEDDITDLSGGTRIFYRLTRTMAQNQDWQKPAYTDVDIYIMTHLEGISADTISNPGGSPKARITWKPFTGLWPQGTTFSLIKKNTTDGTQQSISIEEDSARAGSYTDDNIPSCKYIKYTISVKLGNHYDSPPEEDIPGHILTSQLALLSDLTASKGYFPDRTTLRWQTTGSYDHYALKRKVYGSSDPYVLVSTIDGSGLNDLKADDDQGTPGVYYQYKVTGLSQCSNVSLHSNALYAIGFRSPTGTVYGRVTYDKGGGSVRDVVIRMESRDNTQLGKSLYLDGQYGSGLEIDSLHTPLSDSAFTFEAWIKPDDAPKDQAIFDNPGLYRFGFNSEGQIYFDYNGHQIAGDLMDTTVFTHVAAIHNHDSLWIIQDDSVIAAGAVPFQPGRTGSQQLLIGTNSDRNAHFKGYLDEVRVWNKALSYSQIVKDDSRLLTGGESGLIAYWRFDASVKDQFYDISHEGDSYNRNDGTMDPLHVQHSNVIPTTDQLSLKAFTDSTGNYTITGIPYTGVNGTTYTIAPRLSSHHFDPVSVTRIFSSGSSTFTLDFKDESSYIVSGTVTYEHTNVPVQGVQFKIDGNFAYDGAGTVAQTNGKGQFRISVPVGVHTVQAVKTNHVFANQGKILDASGKDVNYQQNLSGILLQDSTKIRFIGRIAGGTIQSNFPPGFSLSKNILGDKMAITLTSKGDYFLNFNPQKPAQTPPPVVKYYRHTLYSSRQEEPVKLEDSTKVVYDKNKIVIYPDISTGEFEAELIPADFLINKNNGVLVEGYPSPLQSTLELNLRDSLIKRTITDSVHTDSVYYPGSQSWSYQTSYDTVKYNASYIFTYNVDPTVTVKQVMGPGNPYTFDYFGDAVYTFTNVLGEHIDIPAYDTAAKKYTFGKPVFVQGNSYTFKINSFQHFPYYDQTGKVKYYTDVPSLGGQAIIHNEMKAVSGPPEEIPLDSQGTAYYTFHVGSPELVSPYLKGYAIGVQIGQEVYQWKNGLKQDGFVFGGQPEGSDFVTAGPDIRVGILRDPPGSHSFAYLEQGFTFSHTIKFRNAFNSGNSLGATASFIPEMNHEFGIGVQEGLTVSPILKLEGNYITQTQRDSTNTITTSLTFTSSIKSSDDPSFDGASDDIFIGYSTNITYGKSRVLCAIPYNTIQTTDSVIYPLNGQISEYAIVQREGLHFGQQFNTMFVYPQYYIVKYLIPNLINIRDHILAEGTSYANPQTVANSTGQEVYVSLIDTASEKYGTFNTDSTVWGNAIGQYTPTTGPSYQIYFPKDASGQFTTAHNDTIMYLDQQIQSWKKWLKENEKYKVTANYDKNYSFGAGSSLDIVRQVDTAYSHEEHFSYLWGGTATLNVGLLVNEAGLVTAKSWKVLHTPTDTTGTVTRDSTRTIGFHLEEGGSNYMSVSVGNDPKGFPLYQIKGGVTSCPYEGATTTKYYQPNTPLNQPTIQREKPEIDVEGKAMVTGIPANRAASYTLKLSNASTVKGDIYFGLKVIDKSNPYGAKVYLDGTPLGNGRTILIPSGETVTKTLTVEKGPDSMNYDNIEVILHSLCQYNPQVYTHNIFSKVYISAHFKPGCSDIHLSSPADHWIINTLSPKTVKKGDTIPYLPIVLDDYDLNKNLFDHVALQYKSSTGSDWITTANFYTSQAAYDQGQGNRILITSADETDYKILLDNTFADGRYDIRALSVCRDNGKIVAQTPSNTVSGIKDTYRPRPFGNPQPVNGILGIGQSAKVKFNEPIDIGYLNQQPPTTFFTVRGIKNGAAIDSTVAIQLDGQKDYAITEFDKNMAGKDFTVSLWFMPDKKEAGTLFSQGNKNRKVELALTNDYRFRVIIGNKAITGSHTVQYLPGQWVHAALVYDAQDSTLQVFYNYQPVLTAIRVPAYEGVGPFVFGKSLKNSSRFFAGKIRNVRIWTTALTSIKLQENSVKRLSGGENHLLACYPMDEGLGHILHDKAHGNNADFTGKWKMPEGRSVSFSGNGHVRMNTGQAVITSEMDFTLGLWFKALPGQGNATLISSGKGDGTDLGGSENLFSLGFNEGKLTFYNNGFRVQVTGNYLDNNWHHMVLAANRNTGIAQFYVDGKLRKYFDAGNLGWLAATYTYLGARAYRQAPDSTVTHFDQYFKGNIDEVRIWNTYLNNTIISKEGNVRLSGEETGLLAYYPFEKHKQSSSGVWSTIFTASDQKVQKDANNYIPDPVLTHVEESREKAPMKAPGPEQNLSYDFVANNDAIILNFTGGAAEMKAIDKTIVTFTATNIRDMHGNYIASPVTWTAYIDQNPLDWSDEQLNLSKDVNKEMQFTAFVVNSGGSEEHFNLDNLPAWLTADITSGTVPPEGKQKITFVINKGLNVGTYNAIIALNNSLQQTQSLELNLKVTGNTPDWKVNPADFAYSMTVYGKLRINHIFSDNPEDMLAAFMDGKCVGVAYNTYIKKNDFWYVFLTIYGNSLQADNLSFRIWDAGNGRIYSGIPTGPIDFENGAVAGTPRTPVIFDGRELIIENMSLKKGWNWLSFNLYTSELKDVDAMLSNGVWQSGDMIKNMKKFDQYSTTEGWLGTLPEGAELDNLSLYKLKTGTSQVLSIEGTPLDIKHTSIPLKGGQWNYISYLPTDNMTLKDALAGYQARNGDQIKSQTGFAMYDSRLGWVGNLTYLEPGKGYMLYRTGLSDTAFTYPSLSGILRLRMGADPLNSARLNPWQLPTEENFAFADNMTVVAAVDKDFHLLSNDKVLAYAGTDLRAKAKAIANPATGKQALFFNIPGKTAQMLHFEVERNGKVVARTGTVMSYHSGNRIGSLKQPFMLYFGKQQLSAGVSPNPFHDKLTIRLHLSHGRHTVQMLIYNMQGQLVFRISPETVSGKTPILYWDGHNNSGAFCDPGVYLIRLLIDEKPLVYKVIKY